ncbi:MAG: hypothetical protein ACTH1Z_08310 [Ancrocorticia sp.]|uniref:hypothetical protein n=1 Tax=Ancrocorticia sp. TaxID=2593684 RepID=UPI003F9195E5
MIAPANEGAASNGVRGTGATGKRQHRAAVRLSRVDSDRISRGELASESEALHQALTEETGDAATRNQDGQGVAPRDARERQILDEVPPHFGKL